MEKINFSSACRALCLFALLFPFPSQGCSKGSEFQLSKCLL